MMVPMARTDVVERNHRIRAGRRQGDRVMPLELFRPDLRALHHPVHRGDGGRPHLVGPGPGHVAAGPAVVGPWVGYAWLTSVVDPQEGATRLVFPVATAVAWSPPWPCPTPSATRP